MRLYTSNRSRHLMCELAVIICMLFILAVTFGFVGSARSQQSQTQSQGNLILDTSDVYATDGDTIRYLGVNYRLMGFDTPETFRSKCELELKLGLQAKERLLQLIRGAKEAKLQLHGLDKYKRILAVLLIDDKDVAHIMIGEGLADEYHGKTKRREWCTDPK